MANYFKASFDASEWDKVFNHLTGPMKESLARTIGSAAGAVFRDEAKAGVPKSVGPYNPNSRGSSEAGTLRDAIYLGYDKRHPKPNEFTYNVSWNSRLAWWGKLVEFGHWQIYQVYFDKNKGYWRTGKTPRLGGPKWIPGAAFLRGAQFRAEGRAVQAGMIAGRYALPVLLGQIK